VSISDKNNPKERLEATVSTPPRLGDFLDPPDTKTKEPGCWKNWSLDKM
jgi:hypothetical protein